MYLGSAMRPSLSHVTTASELTPEKRAWLRRYEAFDLRFAPCIAACCLVDVGGILCETELSAVCGTHTCLEQALGRFCLLSIWARVLAVKIYRPRAGADPRAVLQRQYQTNQGHVQAAQMVAVSAAVRAMWKLRQ